MKTYIAFGTFSETPDAVALLEKTVSFDFSTPRHTNMYSVHVSKTHTQTQIHTHTHLHFPLLLFAYAFNLVKVNSS